MFSVGRDSDFQYCFLEFGKQMYTTVNMGKFIIFQGIQVFFHNLKLNISNGGTVCFIDGGCNF